MQKFDTSGGRDGTVFAGFGLSQRLAVFCGGLCLLATMVLALLGGFSSRYLFSEQEQLQGRLLAARIAAEIAPLIAATDLLRLKVSLQQLREKHRLLQISVVDVEGRLMASAGKPDETGGRRFGAFIYLEGHIAGEATVVAHPSPVEPDLERMSLGLLALALLLSVFAAMLGARWGRERASRIARLTGELSLGESGTATADELEALEAAVARLPLDLLKPPAAASTSTADYREAGLLYIRFDSLETHVETLDETSLLAYTEHQRRLIDGAAQFYGGKIGVVRQFGMLVSFDADRDSGSSAFRAVSTAWLIRQSTDGLNPGLSLRIQLSMACGLTETGLGSPQDIYPDLYNQHLIDELAAMTAPRSPDILLSESVAADAEVINRCELADSENHPALRGFLEPYCDLLERQQKLLLRELESA